MLKELHAIFYGNVQGVFFRATTKDIARDLGLVGTVENLPDGSVEVFAQGDENSLKQLVSRLEDQFQLDPSRPMDLTYSEPGREFNDFRVI